MTGDTDLAALGAVLAERARTRILLALGDGRALAASVLAAEAGVAPSTASAHLARLVEAGLLGVTVQGRHRYYRLAGPEVAEAMLGWLRHADRGRALHVTDAGRRGLGGEFGLADPTRDGHDDRTTQGGAGAPDAGGEGRGLPRLARR